MHYITFSAPSSRLLARAMNPKGWSLRHDFRSSANRPAAIPAMIYRFEGFQMRNQLMKSRSIDISSF
jgi:hypothetical protein